MAALVKEVPLTPANAAAITAALLRAALGEAVTSGDTSGEEVSETPRFLSLGRMLRYRRLGPACFHADCLA